MNIENLSMEYGTEEIFNNISIRIKPKDKVGIVGVNGAGKSTLFKIIMREIEPSSGKITIVKNARIGFLPQVISDVIKDMNINVFDFLLSGRPIKKLEKDLSYNYELASIEKDINSLNKIMDKINKIESKLDYWDRYQAESILLKIIDGMGINSNELDMKLCELSGGQKSKIAFARLLYSKPEILLLDEPTNHLDIESKDYIINYLKKYDGLVLIISHDIEFLNEVTTSTLYLDKVLHQIELFPGNYQKYLKIKSEREQSLERVLEKQEREEQKLQRIIDKYLHGNEKKANIAKDRQKKLAKLEKDKVVLAKKNKVTTFKITINDLGGIMPLKVDDLFFSYNDKNPIINDLRFSLTRGEKFLIVGENGVGKSTLLKLIVGLLTPTSGIVTLGYKTSVAYYAQEHELLNNDKNIIENFDDSGLSIQELRSLLGSFLFTGDDVFKKVAVLSPGERSRVALAKIAIAGANILILDEPTNHLDPDTEKIIAQTFKTYTGTMLLVSHNLDFIDDLGIERMLMLPSGRIQYYDKNTVKYYHDINLEK